MTIKFNSTDFSACLADVSKIVSEKNPMPILTGVLVEATEDSVTLTGSDEGMELTSSIKAESDGSMSFVINPKVFASALKSLPQQTITMVVEDDLNIKVNYNKGSFQMVAQNGEEYPRFNWEEGDAHQLVIKSDRLKYGFNGSSCAIAEDDLRPQMCGIYFDMQDCLTMVATDSKKLIRITLKDVKNEGEPYAFIMPVKVVNVIKSIAPKESDVVIKSTERAIRLSYEGNGRTLQMSAVLVEGRFPRYNAVIPQNNTQILTLDRQSTIALLSRIISFSNSATNQIKVDIGEPTLEGQCVTFSAQDIDYSIAAHEQMTCSYNGSPMKVGFRANFMLDILKSMNGEEFELRLSDPARAALLAPVSTDENTDYLALLMPMMLQDF